MSTYTLNRSSDTTITKLLRHYDSLLRSIQREHREEALMVMQAEAKRDAANILAHDLKNNNACDADVGGVPFEY